MNWRPANTQILYELCPTCFWFVYLTWGQPLAIFEFPQRTTEITYTKRPISAEIKGGFLYKICPILSCVKYRKSLLTSAEEVASLLQETAAPTITVFQGHTHYTEFT